jgi:hypothetical protein
VQIGNLWFLDMFSLCFGPTLAQGSHNTFIWSKLEEKIDQKYQKQFANGDQASIARLKPRAYVCRLVVYGF